MVGTCTANGCDRNSKWITMGYVEAHRSNRKKKSGMNDGRRN
jgi:hypothetical protein